jgi:hypothetical protein
MELAGAVALWLLAASSQAAGQEGTVSGTLALNGRTVALSHVYASAQPGFFDKATEDFRILLSDVPLPDATRADEFALIGLGRNGEGTIVEVTIDAGGSAISGALFAREFHGMVSAAGMHVWTPTTTTRTRIAGRLATSGRHTIEDVTFAYDVTFDAPIPRPSSVAERTDALATPAAQAGAAYVAAIEAGDRAAFLRTLTADAAREYRSGDEAAAFNQLRADMPPDSRVSDAVPQTDGTVLLTTEGHANGIVISYQLRAVREGEAWKIRPE